MGFEPTKGYKPLLVFKTSAFDHSATSPHKLILDDTRTGGIDSNRLGAILTLKGFAANAAPSSIASQLVEPTKGYKPLLVFKTSAFDHSATSPVSGFAPRIVLAIERKHNISV